MKNYLGNAFSINMLPEITNFSLLAFEKVSVQDVPSDVVSVVGHQTTANLLATMLGFDVPMNRCNLKLDKTDVLYVAQFSGERLPEGATTLPEGAELSFFKVSFKNCQACINKVVDMASAGHLDAYPSVNAVMKR